MPAFAEQFGQALTSPSPSENTRANSGETNPSQ
jgi:hypothetical protein